jgi:hypothetical protein
VIRVERQRVLDLHEPDDLVVAEVRQQWDALPTETRLELRRGSAAGGGREVPA